MRNLLLPILAFLSSTSAVALPAQSAIVYDNGPVVTNPNGPNGPISELQTEPPFGWNALGYSLSNSLGVLLIEDFTVANAMVIEEIEVFFYASNAPGPNVAGVFVSLFDGDPATGTPNQLIPGAGASVDLWNAPPTGISVANSMTGIYRVTETATANTSFQLQSVRIAIPALVLAPGTYYLQWSVNALPAPFCPPITVRNVRNTGNARRLFNSVYSPLTMITVAGPPDPLAPQGMPFRFWGPTGSALPGVIDNLGGGCSTAVLDVRGAPTVGGFARAELTNVHASTLAAILVGLADPNAQLGICGCASRASLDLVALGESLELRVPIVASLAGVELFFQGAELDLSSATTQPCNLGFGFGLTDGFGCRLNVN